MYGYYTAQAYLVAAPSRVLCHGKHIGAPNYIVTRLSIRAGRRGLATRADNNTKRKTNVSQTVAAIVLDKNNLLIAIAPF